MQEKKNKRLFILLIVLLGTTIAVYWLGREENTFKVDKKLFQVADLKTVDQVTLESPSEKIELKLDGSRWKVNDQYKADRNMIDVLFATLQQAEPKRPLASSLQDSIRVTIEREGVKVTLRSGGEVADSFIAGGNSQKTQGYFCREDGSVYLMVIPGYRVYVSGIFELGVNGWRDKYVFGLNWRNLKSVDVNFGQKKTDDFKVLMDESNLTIEGMAQTDTTKLYDFLDAVSLLTVEEYVESTSSLDSLKSTKPALSFLVKDISGKEYSLAVYPSATRQFSGLINGQEWALLQAGQVQAVFRPRPYFLKK